MLNEGQNAEISTKNKHLMECSRGHVDTTKGNKADMSKTNAVINKQRVFNM